MKIEEKRALIANGNLKKAIIIVALPIMLGNLIQTAYNLFDTFFVSMIGPEELTAIGLVWPISFFMISLGLGFNVAGSAFISQYIGAKRYDKAKRVIGQMIIISMVLSVILGAVGYLISPSILGMYTGISQEVSNKALQYIRIIFLGLPTMFFMFLFDAIKRAEGNTMKPMIYSGISVVMNIILDPIFIFAFGFGIRGAAIATVLSRGTVALISISSLFKEDSPLKLEKKDLRVDTALIKRIIHVGIPASLGQSVSAFGFIILNKFISDYGENIVSAFTVGNRINSLVLMPAMGVGSALAVIVGQNLGNNNVKRAKRGIIESVKMCTIFMVIGGGIMYFISGSIVGLFAKDAAIVKPGIEYLRLICITLPLVGYFQILNGIFQGSGHTISAMILMMGRLWIFRIPLILLLGQFEALGERAIWYSMISSNFLICVVGVCIFATGRWQHKIIKTGKKVEA